MSGSASSAAPASIVGATVVSWGVARLVGNGWGCSLVGRHGGGRRRARPFGSPGVDRDRDEQERARDGRDAQADRGHPVARSSRRLVRSSACLNFRDVIDRSARVWEAARRASGFFWRSVGATIASKNDASRSAKCLYIVR